MDFYKLVESFEDFVKQDNDIRKARLSVMNGKDRMENALTEQHCPHFVEAAVGVLYSA